MSAVIVIPCVTVARAELAEARRALAGQGKSVGDDVLRELLWLARALPATLDVLGERSLLDVELGRATVEIIAAPRPRQHLSLLAWRRDDEFFVEIIVLETADLDRDAFDAACVRIAIPLRLRVPTPNSSTSTDVDAPAAIRLQRFSFGAAGKSPS